MTKQEESKVKSDPICIEAWNKATDTNLGIFHAKEEPYVGKLIKIYDTPYIITEIIPLVLPDSPAELFVEVEPVS